MQLRIRLFLLPSAIVELALICWLTAGVCFSQTTNYTYDDLNQLTKVEYPDGAVIEYFYDDAGNRVSKSVGKLPDPDNDGLVNDLEVLLGTNSFDADTDDDGLLDGEEDANHNGVLDLSETNPYNPDSDEDGIQDGTELGKIPANIGQDTNRSVFRPDIDPLTTTNPLAPDTDKDSLKDGQEDLNQNGKVESEETNPQCINPVIFSIESTFARQGAQIKITGTNFGNDNPLTNQVNFYNHVLATEISRL